MVAHGKPATAPSTAGRVLVIEDDKDIASIIAMHLGDNGFDVHVEHEGDTGLAAFRKMDFDLVMLDLILPEVDGLSICREVRASGAYVPVLMLTAKSTELDRVLGLEMGADDYLTKPFSVPELVARVKALLRRVEAIEKKYAANNAVPMISKGGLLINAENRQVKLEDKVIELTAREFDLLYHLASHPGRVYNRAQLLDEVWGYSYEGYEHTVNTHINRLRAKIEDDPTKPTRIQTVWGVGYKFME